MSPSSKITLSIRASASEQIAQKYGRKLKNQKKIINNHGIKGIDNNCIEKYTARIVEEVINKTNGDCTAGNEILLKTALKLYLPEENCPQTLLAKALLQQIKVRHPSTRDAEISHLASDIRSFYEEKKKAQSETNTFSQFAMDHIKKNYPKLLDLKNSAKSIGSILTTTGILFASIVGFFAAAGISAIVPFVFVTSALYTSYLFICHKRLKNAQPNIRLETINKLFFPNEIALKIQRLEKSKKDHPIFDEDRYLCQIGLGIMTSPCYIKTELPTPENGTKEVRHYYDRKNIEKYIRENGINALHPHTRRPITDEDLINDPQLQEEISQKLAEALEA